jgi:hypothetical protein
LMNITPSKNNNSFKISLLGYLENTVILLLSLLRWKSPVFQNSTTVIQNSSSKWN